MGALQGDMHVLMYFLSISSCSCNMSSINSGILILYEALNTKVAPRTKQIEKLIPLFRGNPSTSSRNTSMYSCNNA